MTPRDLALVAGWSALVIIAYFTVTVLVLNSHNVEWASSFDEGGAQ